MSNVKLYLDIETYANPPSFRSDKLEISVLGCYNDKLQKEFFLIGDQVSRASIEELLEGIDTVVTYNGNNFDLRVLRDKYDVDFPNSHDLMKECHRLGIKGGQKQTEIMLGISRDFEGIDGLDAMLLWEKYLLTNDQKHLDDLINYNREDVLNMVEIDKKISNMNWLEAANVVNQYKLQNADRKMKKEKGILRKLLTLDDTESANHERALRQIRFYKVDGKKFTITNLVTTKKYKCVYSPLDSSNIECGCECPDWIFRSGPNSEPCKHLWIIRESLS